MDLALNNLQRLICHKTQQTKPNRISSSPIIPTHFIPFSNTAKLAPSAWAVENIDCISAER